MSRSDNEDFEHKWDLHFPDGTVLSGCELNSSRKFGDGFRKYISLAPDDSKRIFPRICLDIRRSDAVKMGIRAIRDDGATHTKLQKGGSK